MQKLILIKLGGSLLTDKNKPYTVNHEILKQISSEIAKLSKQETNLFIIGHGGGSFPHVPAKLYQTQKGFINNESQYGMALVQDAASQLNRIVVKSLLEQGAKAFSINPSSVVTTKNGKIIKWTIDSLVNTLKNYMLPVVYGDVVFDEAQGCAITSTEVLLNYLAINLKDQFKIEKIIYLGDTNGVWDENKKIIPVITPQIYSLIQKSFGSSRGIDVTGGMEHKMSEAMEIAKAGVEVVIANGNTPGILEKIVGGKKTECTVIKN